MHLKRKAHPSGMRLLIFGIEQNPQSCLQRDFLFAALDTATCAAFFTESRMKFVNALELDRKSGERRVQTGYTCAGFCSRMPASP